ncbi:YbfB/YjiJ family MFS transporter [Lysinibacillus sp. NPDC048646]|uniref:YbfB/YjiJ family MFS transporter n=1 Tax=Lysinibacillus sp. NPDC048646 TaxID=3390574 RepID=UPI003CFCCCFC
MNKKHAGVLLGGILLLVIAMGISRFAFTPILPFMRRDAGFTLETAGYLASSNFVGYFVGALWAGFLFRRKKYLLLISVILNILSIIWMGLTEAFFVWMLLRFIAGVTGGLIFVLTSSIIMDYLAQVILTKWSGYLFSGIGLGIAISGLLVPYLEISYTWKGAWLGLGILSLAFFCITLVTWRNLTIQDGVKKVSSSRGKMTAGFMPWLIASYGLEGLGYIITGTFLVDIIHNIPALSAYSSYSWVVVGLAAVPSAPVWIMLLSKYSPVTVLSVAYVMQVIGIILPVFSQTVPSVLVSAFLFGMTFVGIVTMTTSYARQTFPSQSNAVVSVLTTYYAFGQIIGPIIAGKLAAYYESYKAALLFAGIMVFAALVIMLVGHYKTQVRLEIQNNSTSIET